MRVEVRWVGHRKYGQMGLGKTKREPDETEIRNGKKREVALTRKQATDDWSARVLLCFTGSVATIKAVEVINEFAGRGCDVCVILTQAARKFVDKEELDEYFQEYSIRVYTDDDEWSDWKKVGDPVTHIELRKWATHLVIAPLSANTLAKMANGLCDNLLTCVWRAWEFDDVTKRVWVAPAMNTAMWKSPFTARHLAELTGFPNVFVIDPIAKTLACGDTGIGAMAEPGTIVNKVLGPRYF